MGSTARFAALVALTLVLGGGAWAQDQPSVPAAEAITPRKLELANELIEVSGGKALLQNMIRGMGAQIAAAAGSKLSADQKTQMEIMVEAEGNALAKRFPDLQRAMATGYAETYSEQELSDILAFYRSPSGRAVIAKAPQVMQGVMVAVFKMMPEIQHDAGEEVCAKISCTAAQKAAFMGDTPANP
jgi:hypothetical protein